MNEWKKKERKKRKVATDIVHIGAQVVIAVWKCTKLSADMWSEM